MGLPVKARLRHWICLRLLPIKTPRCLIPSSVTLYSLNIRWVKQMGAKEFYLLKHKLRPFWILRFWQTFTESFSNSTSSILLHLWRIFKRGKLQMMYPSNERRNSLILSTLYFLVDSIIFSMSSFNSSLEKLYPLSAE